MVRAHGTRAASGGGSEKKRGPEAKPATPVQRMLALQRLAGNAAVARAVAEERHEHGAGCGHEQPAAGPAATGPSAVQRAAAQRSSVEAAIKSPSRPLDSHIREKAERGYGMSFGHVRVHSGPVAQRSAVDMGAIAYTTGSHIIEGPRPMTPEEALHEAGHIYQQAMGPVAGTDNGAGVKVSDKNDRDEKWAAANGRKLANGGMPDL